MVNHWNIRDKILFPIALVFTMTVSKVYADYSVLDLYAGRWDVQVRTLQPEQVNVTYSETFEWVLNRKFLVGKTENKSDGTEDISYGTYDEQTKGYPFWIFSSSGTYIYLAPATWDARTRTMEWKNPPNSDIFYHTQVVFPDDKTRHWTVLVKDWKGTVLLHQKGNAVRRND